MGDERRACLIYVTAMAGVRGAVRAELEADGYAVCEVKAELEAALAAQAGASDLPPDLTVCIAQADVCVFLLPEAVEGDGLLGAAAALSQRLGKRMVGVVAGGRDRYPAALDDGAQAVVRQGSSQLRAAVGGAEVWEGPGGSPVPDRIIRHVRCQ